LRILLHRADKQLGYKTPLHGNEGKGGGKETIRWCKRDQTHQTPEHLRGVRRDSYFFSMRMHSLREYQVLPNRKAIEIPSNADFLLHEREKERERGVASF
jgi:hypothetical protein